MIIGLILHYSRLNNTGVIIDKNSIRHQFSSKEWKEDTDLKLGLKVTFDLDQDDQAINIRQDWLIT